FQAEDGIRDLTVTGVQTCALPIYSREMLGRDANDGAERMADAQALAQYIGSAGELRLPVCVTKHNDRSARRHTVVVRGEEPAEYRSGIEEIQVARARGSDIAFARGLPVADRRSPGVKRGHR